MKNKFKHIISSFGCFLLISLFASTDRLSAQDANAKLPQYSDSLRWGRIAELSVSTIVSEIELGKARGMSVDEIGTWLGNYYAATWPGGLDARHLATGFRWNYLSDPKAKVNITTFTDTLVVMRCYLTEVDYFGPDKRYRGVTLDELNRVYDHINRITADYVGVKLDIRYDGDWVVFTFRNGYKRMQASDEVRWNRSADIIRFIQCEIIRTGKAVGKTPRELGLATAKTWESTWVNVDSPWRLLRGIAWNNFSDPEFVCEILSASPAMVQAKCNRPWIPTVRASQQLTGVTVDDYEAYQLGIEQGIANYLRMTWEVKLESNDRIITVRKAK
jgi:hypothetical protein